MPLVWNVTRPCLAVVAGNFSGKKNEVWLLAARVKDCTPRELPSWSEIVAVTVTPLADGFAIAIPVPNPEVLSNGATNFGGNCVCSDDVPSEIFPLGSA